MTAEPEDLELVTKNLILVFLLSVPQWIGVGFILPLRVEQLPEKNNFWRERNLSNRYQDITKVYPQMWEFIISGEEFEEAG